MRNGVASRLLTALWVGTCLTGGWSAAAAGSVAVRSLKEIREHGVVMQRWETSCAAASVATVLTYAFHDPVSEEQAVSEMLGRTEALKVRARGGFSLLDMKRFVEARGYQASAMEGLALQDLRALRAPIVPLRRHGANHYVVVNAIAGDRILLADPAFGNRQMDLEEFRASWLDGLAFVITTR